MEPEFKRVLKNHKNFKIINLGKNGIPTCNTKKLLLYKAMYQLAFTV